MTGTMARRIASTRPVGDGPVLRSPAGALHAALGADLAIESGWEIPRSYGAADKERRLVTNGLAIADITARSKIDVRGRIDASMPVGVDGDIVATIDPQWRVVVGPPRPVEERVEALQLRAGPSAMVTDVTHLHAGFALCGPLVPELLARITSWNPSGLEPGQAAAAPIVAIRSILLRRDLPFPAWEAYVSSEFGRYAWRTLTDAVRSLDGGPVGWDALRAEGWG